MDKLINELTQKDENKALNAANLIINNKNIEAFEKLCEKSDFLFDFVKNNVCKRFEKAINKSNYKNVIEFFSVYDETYATTLVKSITKYADEDLTDKIYELLESGTTNQKKYASKYFQFIPDTIAQELLENYAFCDDIELAINSAQALGAMNDSVFFNQAIKKLNTNDEFELIKVVRFLCSYGDKNAIEPLLNILDKTTTAENIAGEIPYLSPFTKLLETHDLDKVLICFDLVLSGLGEIFALSDIFFYETYDTINTLIEKQTQNPSSHIAQVLLRALDKFSTFNSNEEYSFDESKDTKEEIKAIFELLQAQNKEFWMEQKNLISNELTKENISKQRIVSTLETIQALKLKETKKHLIDFINTTNSEQLLVMACGVASSIQETSNINFTQLEQKLTDSTLKAILNSYSL